MVRNALLFVVAICWVFTAPHTVPAAQTDDILSKIERMASLSAKEEPSLGETVVEGIEKNPAEVSKALLLRLKNKTLTEKQLAVYVWALGLTGDRTTANAIIDLHRQSKSDLVRGNCLRSLATSGGKQAEEFLLSVLATTTDKEMRFNILNLLSQMQCEAALPKTEEVLGQDPKEFYWQSIFVFGKMGDKAVPFLLTRLNDKDYNVRANAINVLGVWLIAPEAGKSLQDRFWAETDAELRGIILNSLGRTFADPAQFRAVLEQVVANEKDVKLVTHARKAIDGIDEMKAAIAAFAKAKRVSAASFQNEYAKLFKSAGKKGDYEALFVSSTADDEPKLKTLRERILQRDSDEAFYDYQKVNNIILRNRMIKVTNSKTVKP